jgi:hypothetical protein
MAHLAYHAPVSTPQRKKAEKTTKPTAKTAKGGRRMLMWNALRRSSEVMNARAVKGTHDAMIERGSTSFDVSAMTRFDAAMSEAEVVAKFLGISVEEAAKL